MEKKDTKKANTTKNKNSTKTVQKSAAKETQQNKNEITEKFLPIGTVVLLKGGKKRVMITGFCVSRRENPTEIWDYSGCLYPEGILTSDSVLLFDHTQITEIFHIGLVDDEEKNFKEKLKEELQKNNKKTDN